jgi:hypothetical protein
VGLSPTVLPFQKKKRRTSSSKSIKGKYEQKKPNNPKNKLQGEVLTSSPEVTDRWLSREVLIAAAFFRRLEARELPFLAGASGDFTTTPASGEGGLL